MATDEEIFDSAIAPEQTENAAETPPEAPTEAEEQPTRDERGRFTKAATEQPEQSAEAPLAQPEREEAPANVPSWRLAEEAQRRRDAEARYDDLQNQLRQMQMHIARQQQPAQPPPQPVDPFADPNEWAKQQLAPILGAMQQQQLETSLRFARYEHKDKFDEAYKSFMDYVTQSHDQPTYQRVMQSGDPGQALVSWHRQNQLENRLNGMDLDSFIEAQIEERMKDPKFQAKTIEATKAALGQNPSNPVQLPPSMARVASAGSVAAEVAGQQDSSPEAYWAYATKGINR